MEGFVRWMDIMMDEILPKEVVALNFNLDEEEEGSWSLTLIGCESFGVRDSDWIFDEIYSTETSPLLWKKTMTREKALADAVRTVKLYLKKGKYAERMKSFRGVGVGFTDTPPVIVYHKLTK